MENIDITLLKPHPRNFEIYGEEDIKQLAEKIKISGWIKPLVINKDNVIISGHRRCYACLGLGIKTVPYERINFNNENEELERLLLENENREKTTYQKTNEGLMWEEVIKEKARLRMSLGGQGKEKIPTLEKGQTRDIVAEKIGIGSGKTYETAKKVVNEIDKLKDEGKEKDSEFLKIALNDGGVNTAKKIVSEDLTKVDDELKDKVINKEITPKQAIKEIQKVNEGVENFPQGKQEDEKSNIVQNSSLSDIEENQITSEADKEIEESKKYCDNRRLSEEINKELESNTTTLIENIVADFISDKEKIIRELNKYLNLEKEFEEIGEDKKLKKEFKEALQELKESVNKLDNLVW